MIKFILFGIEGEINDSFELKMTDEEIKSVILKDIEVFLSNFKPQDGDPFLVYADRLKDFGAKIIKAEETEGEEDTVY